ncbi:hypothetical protein HKD37_03G008250 [Glycine soja]
MSHPRTYIQKQETTMATTATTKVTPSTMCLFKLTALEASADVSDPEGESAAPARTFFSGLVGAGASAGEAAGAIAPKSFIGRSTLST